MCLHLVKALAKVLEVLGRRREYLLAPLLTLLRGLADEVAPHGLPALLVWREGRVKVTHGTNDGLTQRFRRQVVVLQELRSAIVGLNGLGEVGVAVGEVGEGSGEGREAAETAVSATNDPHRVPEVAIAEPAGDNRGGPRDLLPWSVEATPAADVVDLSRDEEALVARRHHGQVGLPGRQERGGVLAVFREAREELVQRRVHSLEGGSVAAEVHHDAGLGQKLAAEGLEARLDRGPVRLRRLQQVLDDGQVFHAPGLL
mmetsp:Transcript_23884/g.70004  ORF Transcript_23884/g.70004 Transcript_23884/m.70004 type:complete len:258 (+) Transcript_23884:512-1285(+)